MLVRGIAVDSSLQPIAGALVVARLNVDAAYVPADNQQLGVADVTATAGSDGSYQLELMTNDDPVEPVGTAYTLEVVHGGLVASTYSIVVPSAYTTGLDHFNVSDLIVAVPATPGAYIRGPQGPPGAAGAGATFAQTTASTTWSIAHALNRAPLNVAVIDSNGHDIVGFTATFPDTSHVTLTFAAALAGTAYLS